MNDALNDDDPAAAGDDESAASIADRVANGEHMEDHEPPEPKMGGDVQLSLNVGALVETKARKVSEATVSLTAAEVEVDGLFKPELRYPFLVMGVPGNVNTVYLRDPKSTAVPKAVKGVKLRQTVNVESVKRADTAESVYDLFGAILENDPEEAGSLLERLQALTTTALRSVA